MKTCNYCNDPILKFQKFVELGNKYFHRGCVVEAVKKIKINPKG